VVRQQQSARVVYASMLRARGGPEAGLPGAVCSKHGGAQRLPGAAFGMACALDCVVCGSRPGVISLVMHGSVQGFAQTLKLS
jgi:hypothetical protein